ncbi:hypothetical protein PBY51_016344 [Eleginops maclovinus]|uniref:Uncharacterized protein n=1 Tax=Eleginops maclovinus TaxID=56733 RepID=A0AAN7XQZ1_ELEMC|nr:hypothetical protein PBY51_016344 [Eleginops maclovinus]
MDIRRGSNPNEMWQEADDAEPGRAKLPLQQPIIKIRSRCPLHPLPVSCSLAVRSIQSAAGVCPEQAFPLLFPSSAFQ